MILSEANKKLKLETNEDETTLVIFRHQADFIGYHISTTTKIRKETRDGILKIVSARRHERSEERFWSSVAGMPEKLHSFRTGIRKNPLSSLGLFTPRVWVSSILVPP